MNTLFVSIIIDNISVSNRTKKTDTGNRTGLLAGVGLEPTTSGL